MEGVIFACYAISFILLMSMVNYIREICKPGICMSKHVAKQRIKIFGIAGGVFLVLAVLLTYMWNG
ncbi:hypothetical protein [Bacillus sp. FJAT-42315]|uniref:hypothetical protein n=1 Tax=Bacillus sp. FJAT-42315 TaxID=2014077 RepID=UPI000C24F319|nr:hypothetical protein [Bacillus sp. FJAT-42315]